MKQPRGIGNWLPWSGEPWADHGEPGHGTFGKRLGLWDSCEVSPGVRTDPEAPMSKACVQVGSRVSGTRGKWKRSPLASSRRWTTTKCIREPSGYSSPEGWKVVEGC